MAVVAVNKTVINLPSGRLSSVGAEASGLSEVLALSIVDPCVESLLHPSTTFCTIYSNSGQVLTFLCSQLSSPPHHCTSSKGAPKSHGGLKMLIF